MLLDPKVNTGTLENNKFWENIMKPFARILLSSMALLFFVGCSSMHSQQTASKPIYGQIIEDRYYAPNGLFSVKAPKSAYIEECFADGMTPTVAFRDDSGTLFRIEVLTDDCFLNLREEDKNEFSAEIYHTIIEPNVKAVSPYAKTILEDNTDDGFLAIIDAPGCSTLVDQTTNKRADAIRALLIAYRNNQLVMVSYQDFVSSTLPAFTQDVKAQKKYFFEKMHNILITFQ